ncbi:hypothetical protein MPNT_140004 [Candidatus Methylacidithermus pantelleriae]|uniref:Uncharacterized protein n=1 Tax=Candidatus Methylacidithermus pantelleriae TaxID=2744239 RepID=A0A8J2FN58_9BACT|nr:hypothetical protein MPNT_140004 [Candidatus Methylacidithermus pantelleriae]
MGTASIQQDVTAEEARSPTPLYSARADVCNQVNPVVREHCVWNRVALHQRPLLHPAALGNAFGRPGVLQYHLDGVHVLQGKEGMGMHQEGATRSGHPLCPYQCALRQAQVHIKSEVVLLSTIDGRVSFALHVGEYPKRICASRG